MIELQAPNLTTFEFDNYLTQIVLTESLKLSEATFVSNMRLLKCDGDALDYILTELPTPLPHVHKLFLHLDVIAKVRRFSKTQTIFINMRHLNLNLNIIGNPRDASWVIGLVDLLELTPLLEEFEPHMDHPYLFSFPDSRTVTAVPGHVHHHLRSVYVTGFYALVELVELALYILENATVLERMVVDPVIRMKSEYLIFNHIYSLLTKHQSIKPKQIDSSTCGRPVHLVDRWSCLPAPAIVTAPPSSSWQCCSREAPDDLVAAGWRNCWDREGGARRRRCGAARRPWPPRWRSRGLSPRARRRVP